MAASNRTSMLQVKFVVDGDGRVVAAFGNSADSAEKAAKALDHVATEADRADQRMAKTAETFRRAGVVLGTVIAAAAVAVATGLTAATKAAIDNADAMRDLSIRTGVGVETLSAYSYAARQTGTDVDTLGTGLKVLARNVAAAVNPTSAQAKIFEALGIKVTDATGKLRQLDDLLPQIADKYQQLEDGTTKAALAQALFGRSGLDLTEFLNQGSKGLDEFAAKAQALGIIIDDKTAAAADNFNDTLDDLRTAVSGIALQLASDLLPDLQHFVSSVAELARQGDKPGSVVKGIADGIRVIGVVGESAITLMASIVDEIAGITQQGWGYYQMLAGILSLDLDRIKSGWSDAKTGGDKMIRGATRLVDPHGQYAIFPDADPQAQGSYSGPLLEPSKALAAAQEAAQKKAKAEADALAKRLGLELSNPTAPSNSGANEAATAAASFQTVLERLRGELDGPLGRAEAEHARRLRDITKLAETGKVGHEQLAEAVRLEGDSYAETAEKIKQRFEQEIGSLSGPVAQEEAEHQRRLQEIDEISRQYVGTGDRVNTMLAEEARQHAAAAREAARQADPAAALLDDMSFELRLLGLSNADRETAIALRRLEGQVTDDQADAIMHLNRTLDEQRKNVQFMDDFRNDVLDFGVTAVNEFGQIDDSFKSMMDNMAKQVERRILQGWIDDLFGPQGSTGKGTSGGDFFNGLLGALFGGGNNNSGLTEDQMYAKSVSPGGLTGGDASGGFWSTMAGLFFGGNRAAGGETLARHFYRVNENQPELLDYEGQTLLMMGSRGGRVRPMQPAMAGGNTYNISVGVEGRVDRRTRSQTAAEVGQSIRRAQGRNG